MVDTLPITPYAESSATPVRLPPDLPIEIISKIVSLCWLSPLTNVERITFMKSSVLVSKAWTILYSEVAFKDAFIPSLGYAKYFHNLLDDASAIFDADVHSMPDKHCRSLTFQIERPTVELLLKREVQYSPDNNKSIFDLLDWVIDIPYLPHLRRVSVKYLDCGYTDLFDNMRLVTFPPSVTDLDISYTFRPNVPSHFIHQLQKTYPATSPEGLPLNHVKKLSVFGGGVSATLALLVTSCVGLDAVHTDLGKGTPSREEKEYLSTLRESAISPHLLPILFSI
ncbi:hypothetical protein PLEOSDRAFT_161285 [Pleurotus ostreatus PC15]|uniref:F-box domain-containing protein n=1 Tax=Pleurotus ostreatus (strain PC15) TaxID=1137138 RepID=A0A067NCJ5_PLEO1|nr:hypothetical protein PLEOSDRAFT_161285 [Pleurotus ostreatus PC15]